jgi:uncharacterized SAM-binding protein YcdF (DUF218 family)
MKPNAALAKILRRIRTWIIRLMLALGILLLVAVVFSFTDCPFWAYYWLGTHNADLEIDPELVVVMGGGGMPSPDGLMRCYFGAEIANDCPEAMVIIAVPGDTALKQNSPEYLMCREMHMRGVDSSRIFYERRGMNTRSQALNIAGMLSPVELSQIGVRIVTSPEHMFRSVLAFREVGFKFVGGQPSFGKDIEEELLVRKKLGAVDEKTLKALSLRYNMWNYLKYEITVAREWCAIAYYKLRGWI